jgi:hypothetical protein
MVEISRPERQDEWETIPQVDGAEGDAKVIGLRTPDVVACLFASNNVISKCIVLAHIPCAGAQALVFPSLSSCSRKA